MADKGLKQLALSAHPEVPYADVSGQAACGQQVAGGGMEGYTPRRARVTCQHVQAFTSPDVGDAHCMVAVGRRHTLTETGNKQ